MDRLMWNFTHVEWEGFSPWDLIMPLFLFMAGASIPFALSRYKHEGTDGALYRRIIKRFLLLWIFGMMCQSNLLGLDPERIYLYSNTLQSIAIGYLISALCFLHMRWRTLLLTGITLLLLYWGGMEFLSAGHFGAGSYDPDTNWAEWVDRTLLGRFRDGAAVDANGAAVFADWYRYTWIWSSLNFGATTLSGVLAGIMLKSQAFNPSRKAGLLALIGIVLVALGWLCSIEQPVIKKLWTGSMVLISSGYCYLLMTLSYYLIDIKGFGRPVEWLKVYGMNSIVAYMLASCINFSSISRSLLYGFEQYTGGFYPVLIATANAGIIYLILWLLYRHRVFLKSEGVRDIPLPSPIGPGP